MYFFVCILISQKKYKDILFYSLTMIGSGGLVYLIFPAIINHLFNQGRGLQSIEILIASHIDDQIKYYLNVINPILFGFMLGFIATLIVIMFLLDLINSNKEGNNKICSFKKVHVLRLLCLLLPSTFYVIFVSKSAPFIVDRYISPIYAVLIAGVWSLLYHVFNNIYSNTKVRNFIFLGFASFVVIVGLVSCRWTYLYLDSSKRLDNSEIYGPNSEAIILYNQAWMINPYYLEIQNCNSSVFYEMNTYDQFKETVDIDNLPDNIAFFLIDMEDDVFINDFITDNPEYTLTLDNGSWNNDNGIGVSGHSYYLTKQKEG